MEYNLRKAFRKNKANLQLEKSSERKKTKKKQSMALKLFEFVEQFMMDTFLLKLSQFEITGSIGKTLISLGNLIIKFMLIKCFS